MGSKDLRVSKTTEPKKLAGTIKYNLSKGVQCNVYALGQQSICITVKAIALLTSMFSFKYDCLISYFNQKTEDQTIAGILFTLTLKNQE